jgi:hypothetical protein
MNRAGGGAEADAESAGDDLGESGFAGSRLAWADAFSVGDKR